MLGGVAVGIGTDPAVVLDGGVERLRAVAYIMAEPSAVKDDGLLDGSCVASGCGEGAVLAEGSLESLPDLIGLPGLEADFFRTLAGGIDHGFEVKAIAG